MRIELTIQANYLPQWGVWEGVRELVQNAKDAETEFGAKMLIRHRKDSNTLVIENDGTTLPHEALLFGFTSKTGRSEMIGKFGEGLKLGILALVRFGLKVKIRSGSEVWVPLIVSSDKFHSKVLAFDIYKGRKAENRVQIEISGINTEAWEKIRGCFLFLSNTPAKNYVKTSYGGLLLDTKEIGRIYVKGILVSSASRHNYGYDILEADVDRDRKMVESYDLDWRVSMIWSEAVNSRADLMPKFTDLLENRSVDLQNLNEFAAQRLSKESLGKLAAAFKKAHGENALPVESLSESADLEHLGMKGVVVTSAFRKVLELELGTAAQNKSKIREKVDKVFSWHDLSSLERTNLLDAIALVNDVEAFTIDSVDVCRFRDAKIFGLFVGGRVQINKELLADASATLETLVHEVAHKVGGGDGDKEHVHNLEHIWSGIVAGLRHSLRRLDPTAANKGKSHV